MMDGESDMGVDSSELYSNLYHLTAPMEGLAATTIDTTTEISRALAHVYANRQALVQAAAARMLPKQLETLQKLVAAGRGP